MDTPGLPIIDRNQIYVPMEIVDQILDCLHADESPLRNCALVCKSWTSSCRRNIFYRVVLNDLFSDFRRAWQRSIPTTPNGPHLHTRELTVNLHYFERRYRQSSNVIAAFLEHWFLFVNVRDLHMRGSVDENTLDKISIHDIFGHLSGTLRSLSILVTCCSPQALISLIASFQRLERLDLKCISFKSSQLPHPLPQSHTFEGSFRFSDWGHPSEEFFTLFSEHDLQYREMRVSGERWLQDTGWNKCLAKCADHLEELSIVWTRGRILTHRKFKMPTFNKLRKLLIEASPESTTLLPPVEFLSSITSTRLSEIIINITKLSARWGGVQTWNAIGGYDEVLCQLSNRLKSHSGGKRLALTLMADVSYGDPHSILPRFSEEGELNLA